jgi:hypothetical protein
MQLIGGHVGRPARDSCSNWFPITLKATLTGRLALPRGKDHRAKSWVARHTPCLCVTHDEPNEGAPFMKKILLLIATVVGFLAIQKKLKDQQAEQDLWAEATDKV